MSAHGRARVLTTSDTVPVDGNGRDHRVRWKVEQRAQASLLRQPAHRRPGRAHDLVARLRPLLALTVDRLPSMAAAARLSRDAIVVPSSAAPADACPFLASADGLVRLTVLDCQDEPADHLAATFRRCCGHDPSGSVPPYFPYQTPRRAVVVRASTSMGKTTDCLRAPAATTVDRSRVRCGTTPEYGAPSGRTWCR